MQRPTRRTTAFLLSTIFSLAAIGFDGAAADANPADEVIFRLVNKGSGMCMNIPGGNTDSGAPVTQYPCGDWLDHKWRWDQVDGDWHWLRNVNSNLCLSLPYPGDSTPGDQLLQRPCTDSSDREWRSVRQPDVRYQIVNRFDGQCVGVAGGSKLANAAVIQWPCGAFDDHFWETADA